MSSVGKALENYRHSARWQFNLVYCGPLTKKLLVVVLTHPIQIFQTTISQDLRNIAQTILSLLENDDILSTNPLIWGKPVSTNFWVTKI